MISGSLHCKSCIFLQDFQENPRCLHEFMQVPECLASGAFMQFSCDHPLTSRVLRDWIIRKMDPILARLPIVQILESTE